ncbi:argininosuccinate lyase [Desulfobacca acetoxidans]|uniref:Argininosuccinate lyase n=1 Tax=Desulfobacca acetoxidans (strain ATCC 700848 / DSM 11109 / ASRB2) TaxID=880072 RepID=F2NDN0_DESAR|nr:argininosuccinate lyase [Desulfobacca acetoxidans]AEB10306.1 Argininosuccinate lyase [Desulfobacca acetoxidans DSM 11109]
MHSNNKEKPWGGRFGGGTAKLVEEFTCSLHFDRRLYRYDIAGSMAHARMLARQGILTAAEAEAIVNGLQTVQGEIDAGTFLFDPGDEDIHMAVERRLTAIIGEAGRKLHTARSRNDQIALDIRLFLRDQVGVLIEALQDLRRAGVRLARRYFSVILPGYTHLQRAQPVLFSHHLLAYDEMWRRDQGRLRDCLVRFNVCPLGAAALAGSTFPIDPPYTAELLDFPAILNNSLDAVSDRDFIVEFAAAASLIMVHLSRLAEELILWSSAEFAFIEIADAFCTGSSIMPQKKNPDVAELIRGKSGRVIGHLTGLLVTLKGLPLAYNRDLQEDKEPLFDTVDTVLPCVRLMAGVLDNLALKKEKIAAALQGGFLTATDMADYLVTQGVPFRTAHAQVGQTVRFAETQGKELADLTLEEIKQFAPLAEADLFGWLQIEQSVNRRCSPGGTAAGRVAEALAAVEQELGLTS